jgi:trimethyllysine dioxygenase
VDGVPATPEDTEALAQRISYIRVTHYGKCKCENVFARLYSYLNIGGFWDFTADLAHGDTAYTTLKLQLHTDNTYFTDPSG